VVLTGERRVDPGSGPAAGGAPRRGVARAVWEELLLPVGVLAGLVFIAVALIEGAPLEQFLYAVF
jgi:hypothetical protein